MCKELYHDLFSLSSYQKVKQALYKIESSESREITHFWFSQPFRRASYYDVGHTVIHP